LFSRSWMVVVVVVMGRGGLSWLVGDLGAGSGAVQLG
jgi:hypothetical protein